SRSYRRRNVRHQLNHWLRCQLGGPLRRRLGRWFVVALTTPGTKVAVSGSFADYLWPDYQCFQALGFAGLIDYLRQLIDNHWKRSLLAPNTSPVLEFVVRRCSRLPPRRLIHHQSTGLWKGQS